MKKLRVFQSVKIKKIVPGFSPKNLGTVFLFFMLAPYFVTFLFGNLKEGIAETTPLSALEEEGGSTAFVSNKTALGVETIPLETYVADKLARSIDNDFEMEALKAQAVLIRSGLYAIRNELGVNEIKVQDVNYGMVQVTEKIMEAVTETAGVCIVYNKQPVSGAYFAVSNGNTRNGDELNLTEYSYLKGVPCNRDFLSEDFSSYSSYKKSEFEKIWQKLTSTLDISEEILSSEKITVEQEMGDFSLYRDSADYVLYLERGGKLVTGEQFRDAFYLPSSSFHLEEREGAILISAKGVGHGFGMSQFGANEMAKEGQEYTDILNYFFEEAIITKFE